MLTINLSATDSLPAAQLTMEHSLLSISKWEAVTEKAFFGREEKTGEDMVLYIHQMLLTENPPEDYISRFTKDDYESISNYINSKQTATTFMEERKRPSTEIITSELMYYWLVQFQIPFHPAETWHINRLLTLVQICGRKQEKPKKMSKQELAAKYRALNEQRRKDLGTSG